MKGLFFYSPFFFFLHYVTLRVGVDKLNTSVYIEYIQYRLCIMAGWHAQVTGHARKDLSKWHCANAMGEKMDIIISNSSGVPIYEQIEEQIKSQIMTGELMEGDALPSMRVLAKDLKISIITTKRAYEDLEREGFIESVTGKGSFVKGINSDIVKENMMFAIQELLETAVDKAVLGKISYEEINEMLKLLYDEKKL